MHGLMLDVVSADAKYESLNPDPEEELIPPWDHRWHPGLADSQYEESPTLDMGMFSRFNDALYSNQYDNWLEDVRFEQSF